MKVPNLTKLKEPERTGKNRKWLFCQNLSENRKKILRRLFCEKVSENDKEILTRKDKRPLYRTNRPFDDYNDQIAREVQGNVS